jgi:endonuclease I
MYPKSSFIRTIHPIILLTWLTGILTGCTSITFPSLSSSDVSLLISSTSQELSSETSVSTLVSSLMVSSTSSIASTSSLPSSSSLPSASSSASSSSSLSSTSISSSQSIITIATNAPAYYNGISPSLSGEALKNALDLLISSNVSVGYDWWRFESADESLTETNKVITIYPRRNYLKTAHVSGNQGATWNREHTYPQSKISGAAVNDNHHIFADDWKTNGARSNYRFGLVSLTENNRVKDSSGLNTDNFEGGGFFLPNDTAKGEVARATLYMNTYYGYTLEGNFQTSELAVLWALQYPPTNRDMQRNNRVYTNQGNRNPYVDDTSYICLVYGMTSVATRQACGLA